MRNVNIKQRGVGVIDVCSSNSTHSSGEGVIHIREDAYVDEENGFLLRNKKLKEQTSLSSLSFGSISSQENINGKYDRNKKSNEYFIIGGMRIPIYILVPLGVTILFLIFLFYYIFFFSADSDNHRDQPGHAYDIQMNLNVKEEINRESDMISQRNLVREGNININSPPKAMINNNQGDVNLNVNVDIDVDRDKDRDRDRDREQVLVTDSESGKGVNKGINNNIGESNYYNNPDFPDLFDHGLIISRYDEDLLWLNELVLKYNWLHNIIIYNKGEIDIILNITDKQPYKKSIKIMNNIPNHGKQSETYLRYIIDHYHNLPKYIWFTQGDPFEHSPDYLNLFHINSLKSYLNVKKFQGLSLRYLEKGYPPIYNDTSKYYINNNRLMIYYIDINTLQIVDEPHAFHDADADMLVARVKRNYKMNTKEFISKLCEWINVNSPQDIIPFIYEGIFYVEKSNILRYPLHTYVRLKEEFDKDETTMREILNRLWYYLFSQQSYDHIPYEIIRTSTTTNS